MVATTYSTNQMARDALLHMTEADRVKLAIEIANGATLKSSASALERLAVVARETRTELLQRINDGEVPSDICETFLSVFIDFYDRADCPSAVICHRQTVQFATQEHGTISVPPLSRIYAIIPTLKLVNRPPFDVQEAV